MVGLVKNNGVISFVIKYYCKESRLPYLLCFLMFIFSYSCSNSKKEQLTTNSQNNISTKTDSITMSVAFTNKGVTGFNIEDTYSHSYYLEFNNPLKTDTIITKKVLRVHDNQMIKYLGGDFINGEVQFYIHNYMLNKGINDIKFTYQDNDVTPKNETKIFVADSLFKTYDKFDKLILQKSSKEKHNLLKKLDSVYRIFKNRYLTSKKTYASILNQYQYYSKLQKLDCCSEKVDFFLKSIDTIIVGEPLDRLIFSYVESRINKFNYNKLNHKYSEKYIKLLSIGMFNFLRYEDNKGNPKYKDAIAWLKTTELYKNDSTYIKKQITPLSNTEFKTKLMRLSISSPSDKLIDFSELIAQHPSPYYLIDFWATWCAPCIQGVNTMAKLKLPKNLKVISISLDKIKDKTKWKNKTKALNQNISYWLDDTSEATKAFLKFIELQSIPRYLLIDNNMNLIDQAFYRPEDVQFLPKLQNIENHKYW